MTLRIPPQNLDAEKAALGSALITDAAARWLVANVAGEAFYRESNRIVFAAIKAVLEARESADLITVADRLRVIGKLGEVGGPQALQEMQAAVCVAEHVEHYGRIVVTAWHDRELIRLSSTVDQTSEAQNITARDRALEDIARVCRARDMAGNHTGVGIRDATMEAVRSFDEGPAPMILTGIEAIDRILGGSLPGDVLTIGARTGTGKTALALAVAVNMAEAGQTVAFCGGEMEPDQLVKRIIAARSGVDHSRIRAREFQDGDLRAVNDSAAAIAELPIRFCNIASPSINDIRSFADASRASVVIVDYLTRCAMPRAESMRVSVNLFMRDFKNMAREGKRLNILLAQINRATDKTPDLPPRLADLRESGAIEDESDAVILLHCTTEEKAKCSSTLQANLAKNRHGKTGFCDIEFHRPTQRIGLPKDNQATFDMKAAAAGDTSGQEPY